jgi:CRP/FNR family transcriptional regulator, cyclic AMP receptor protein
MHHFCNNFALAGKEFPVSRVTRLSRIQSAARASDFAGGSLLLTHRFQRLVHHPPIALPKTPRCRETNAASVKSAEISSACISSNTGSNIDSRSLGSSVLGETSAVTSHIGAAGSPSPFAGPACRADLAWQEICKPVGEPVVRAGEIDPLFLFACYAEWERNEEPSAAWELISAAESMNNDNRAQARVLLASSQHLGGIGAAPAVTTLARPKPLCDEEAEMKTPYGLDLAEDCTDCPLARPGFFCAFSAPVLQSLNQLSHKSIMPAGAVLFVEGQTPRGMFILCSGRVNLSTTSREGKILILKTAEPGEVLGLSAAISGMGYETTAETATPCQLNFVERKHLLELMQAHSEVGVHASQSLSRDFHYAYRDIHDLVLTRSSAGKLAKLLLSQSNAKKPVSGELRVNSSMTHEEMAQRIGSSRETVTRLLSDLRRKRLIRLDGPSLVIHDRDALEKLAV